MKASEYQAEAARTSRINWANENGPDIALLGIIGEVGSLASVIKKHQRDKGAYANYGKHFLEEAGDILWYVITVASRLQIQSTDWPAPTNFRNVFEGFYSLHRKIMTISQNSESLKIPPSDNDAQAGLHINSILSDLQGLLQLQGSSLSSVAQSNCDKVLSHWCNYHEYPARVFDEGHKWYERLPRKFSVDFIGIDNDSSLIMVMNGMQIGDRLTDNFYLDDGYRFHDVFHIGGVTTLGWSPVFRSILKRKRKSDRKIDEVEDGARASIIEEAVINHIYDYARPNFLEGMERVDLDLIKRIQNLVIGYEVAACEPWEWQHCILESYRMFRLLREHGGGRLVLDAERRHMEFIHPNEVIV